MSVQKAVILGAGLAGLSTAWKLSKEGVQIELIEKNSQVGGLSRTIRREGYNFDLGGHRFITDDYYILDEIKLLLGDDLLFRPRKSVIRLQNKWFCYPIAIKDILVKVNLSFAMKCLSDYLFCNSRDKINSFPELSVEDWMVNRFGKSMYDMFFKIYTNKLWGISPAELSADWAAQRISQINLKDVLLRAIGIKNGARRTYASRFYYPRKGIGQISESISEVVEKNSGKIHLNSFVKKIYLEKDRIQKIVYEQQGQEKVSHSDFFVSTIPMNEFLRNIAPAVDEEYLKIADSMRFRAIKFLNLQLNTAQVTDNSWIYIPEKDFIFFRIQEPKNWNSYNVPEGKTSLILEIACTEGDEIWNASDDVVYSRCISDLERLGLVNRKEVEGYFVEKERHGYPIYDLTYKKKIEKVIQYLKEIRNLLFIGRQGLFRYNNMDHSIKMGFLASKYIMEGLSKEEIIKIGLERELFEAC